MCMFTSTCDVTQPRTFAHSSLAANYRLITNIDVFYRFNGESNNSP